MARLLEAVLRRRVEESLKLGGCGLDLVVESSLLGGVADVEVVDTLQHADRAVDQLADDVRVAGVTLRVGSDMHQLSSLIVASEKSQASR
jgi:hypothetical protein